MFHSCILPLIFFHASVLMVRVVGMQNEHPEKVVQAGTVVIFKTFGQVHR